MDKTRKLKTAGAIIDFIFAATMLTLLTIYLVFSIKTMNYYNSAENAESAGYAGIVLNVALIWSLAYTIGLLLLTASYIAVATVEAVRCKKYDKNRRFTIFAVVTAFMAATPLAYCISRVGSSLAFLAPIVILSACVIAEIILACIAYKISPRKKDDNCACEE